MLKWSLSLYGYIFLSLYFSISQFLYFSISLFLYFSISLFLYLSISLSLYFSISLFLYLSISLSLYFSISLFLYFSISLFLYFSIRQSGSQGVDYPFLWMAGREVFSTRKCEMVNIFRTFLPWTNVHPQTGSECNKQRTDTHPPVKQTNVVQTVK